jgi:hypothetical protein
VLTNKHELEAEEVKSDKKSDILSPKFSKESKHDTENVVEYDRDILFGNLNTPPVQPLSSNFDERGYKSSSVASSSTSSPKRLATVKSRVLEIRHSQTIDREQEAPYSTVMSSYSLHGKKGAPTHKPDIEKGIQLSVTDATSHSLHLNREEYQRSSNIEHSD